MNGEIVLDPCNKEETNGDGRVLLAYMPNAGKVAHIVQSGKINHTQLQEAVDLCTDACTGLVKNMIKICLVQAFSQ